MATGAPACGCAPAPSGAAPACSPCPSSSSSSSSPLHSLAALSGSLLCSSCCVLQLALNVLGVGCAGFAALDRYKPWSRALTCAVLAHLVARTGLRNRRTVLTVLLALALMGSEEAVSAFNNGALARRLQAARSSLPTWLVIVALARQPGSAKGGVSDKAAGDSSSSSAGGMRSSGGGGSSSRAKGKEEVQEQWDHRQHEGGDGLCSTAFHFSVQGIKCEGCASRLKLALLKHPGVEDATVSFRTGEVAVVAACGSTDEKQLAHAMRAVDLSYQPQLRWAERAGGGGDGLEERQRLIERRPS